MTPVLSFTVEQSPAVLLIGHGDLSLQTFKFLRFLGFLTLIALLPCSFSLAQSSTSQSAQSVTVLNKTAPSVLEDWEKEREFRTLMQTKFFREHSDPDGRIRPDLQIEGAAHVKRMKVAPQIGPMPTVPPVKR